MSTNNAYNISHFLGELHKLYNIGLSNYEIIKKSMFAKTNYITVDVETVAGKQTVKIPSFTYIQSQLATFESNLNAMSTLQDGSGYAVLFNQANGTVRELFELSYSKIPFIDANIKTSIDAVDVVVDEYNKLDSLYTKNVCLKLDVTNATKQYSREIVLTKVRIKNYADFHQHIDKLHAEEFYDRVINYLNEHDVQFEVVKHKLPIEYYKSRYYGSFSALNVTEQSNVFTIKLDTTTFNDIQNIKQNSKELQIGDKLAVIDNNTLFEITSVNHTTNTVEAKRIYGFDTIKVGVSNLIYVDSNIRRFINMPIHFNDNGVYFIETTHAMHGTMSQMSKLSQYSSKNSMITYNDVQMNVDDYAKQYNANNVGSFIKSLMNQYDIPVDKAIKPSKPELTADMLNVVQINKHLVEGSDIDYIKKLYASQNKLASDMKISNEKIQSYQSALEQSNYKNESDRKNISINLSNEKSKYSQLSEQYKNVINELSNKDIGLYASTYAPKYRIRGFWPIENSLKSEYTRNQHIIAYKVQYRYVSANNSIAKADNYSLKQNINGNEVEMTGSFSVWNEFITPTRHRLIDTHGNIKFVENNIADSEQVNINQLDIAINSNEQVDIRIKAITEVGWPNVLTESDWSDTVRIKFPEEFLSDINFVKLEEDVKHEKQKLELNDLLDNLGVSKHIAGSINEQHKYFAHNSHDIDSGFLTSELNRISLFTKLNDMQKQIERLNSIIIGNTNTLKAVIVDAIGNEYPISHNSTIKVFAGFYTDAATTAPKGDIVNHQLYIKLYNTDNMQIYSFIPGDLHTAINNNTYSNARLGFLNSANNALPYGNKQSNGQIVYLRNTNIINNYQLYSDTAVTNSAIINASLLNPGASTKNILQLNLTKNNVEAVALNDNADNFDFIAFSSEHPDYTPSKSNAKLAALLKSYETDLVFLNDTNQQHVSNNKTKVLFDINDKYLIGSKTTGAYLTINATDPSHIQTNTSAIDSFKEIKNNTEFLIPILFQYRMTDALGHIAGIKNYTNNNLIYSRTIGIDMLINGKLTQFDLEVSAQYSSNSLSTNNIPRISNSNISNVASV